ncbi:MAG: methyltransferase domain-containing protein [Bacteroidales bacterium]|nr:methyltransferase domain-containing protein [Bacteroidales bacterium]MBN2757660.1 methyltransferase domain-containing protein [Bacteroidales bacterium]
MKEQEKIYNYSPNWAVLKLIPSNVSNILDIGCGNGGIKEFINKSIKIDGITFSKKEYDLSINKLNNVYLQNLESGLPDNLSKYDVIIASHIIEHIAYPQNLFNDIKKIMHNNSILIVALPNIMHYNNRLKLFFGNFNYDDTGLMDYTHLRWYTYKSAKKLFLKNDFLIAKFFVEGNLPFYRLTKYFPEKTKNIIKKILFGLSKGFFGVQLIYILKYQNN